MMKPNPAAFHWLAAEAFTRRHHCISSSASDIRHLANGNIDHALVHLEASWYTRTGKRRQGISRTNLSLTILHGKHQEDNTRTRYMYTEMYAQINGTTVNSINIIPKPMAKETKYTDHSPGVMKFNITEGEQNFKQNTN